MRFAVVLAFAAAAVAAPASLIERQLPVCSSGTPQCCATNVLDLADLDCLDVPVTPTDVNNFIEICAAEGQKAMCCQVPILGQALLCNEAIPTAA